MDKVLMNYQEYLSNLISEADKDLVEWVLKLADSDTNGYIGKDLATELFPIGSKFSIGLGTLFGVFTVSGYSRRNAYDTQLYMPIVKSTSDKKYRLSWLMVLTRIESKAFNNREGIYITRL